MLTKYYIYNQEQADIIQNYINTEFPDGLAKDETINVYTKLNDGKYAIQESITNDLVRWGRPNWEQTLTELGIDVNDLPLRTINPNEWYRPPID